MAHARIASRQPHHALSGADLPVARGVALLLLLIPVGAGWWLLNQPKDDNPSALSQQLATINPRALFADQTPHFLPTPVAAIPPETNAGPPAPAAADQGSDSGSSETVKVANTGGLGALLRSQPPKGSVVTTLRDGQTLTVLERTQVDGDEWIHVRTPSGADGWIYGRLVGPAQ